jgi:aminoglycoside/choline kinase family phosphotransferase
MTSSRTLLKQQFLEKSPFRGAREHSLKSDASFRHYSRLTLGNRTALLMDAPPDKESTTAFHQIADILHAYQLTPPQILAADHQHGFLLLEDFGDDTYTQLLQQDPAQETALYSLAIDVLQYLHQHPCPQNVPPYDAALLWREVELFIDWALPATADKTTDKETLRASWQALWQPLLAPYTNPQTLVLRDYHVDNLMLLPHKIGLQQCGLLDFQDAVAGHPAYDVVSLLQDARRDISPQLTETMLARYGNTSADFLNAYYILGTQRAFKIVGIFNRLHQRDGKGHYLHHLPRVWHWIRLNCEQPILAPVKAWLEENIL